MKKKILAAVLAAVLFGALILLVRTADVAAIGPAGTEIGLSRINKAVFDFTGENTFWYELTESLGYAAILTGCVFAVLGLLQLIKRKSLRLVDRELLALGGLYAAVALLYVFFELVIVNRRPVLMPGCAEPEASFPSSHTMLVCVMMGSTAIVLKKYVSRKPLRIALQTVCCALAAVTAAGRLLSGAHWFTDILGGLLLSAALLCAFSAVLQAPRKTAENRTGA